MSPVSSHKSQRLPGEDQTANLLREQAAEGLGEGVLGLSE